VPRLEEADAAAAAVQVTPHRVSLEFLRSQVVDREFYSPYLAPHVTICVLLLANGFTVTGESAPADPANFDESLGQKFAEDQAIAKCWPLYGFLLREQLHQRDLQKELFTGEELDDSEEPDI
jgi:Phage protein (N4 Gp49/phage Sf6 gene 66) family